MLQNRGLSCNESDEQEKRSEKEQRSISDDKHEVLHAGRYQRLRSCRTGNY